MQATTAGFRAGAVWRICIHLGVHNDTRTELSDACTQNWHIYESGQSVRTELYVCLCVYRTGVFVNPEFARMAGLHQEEMAAR